MEPPTINQWNQAVVIADYDTRQSTTLCWIIYCLLPHDNHLIGDGCVGVQVALTSDETTQPCVEEGHGLLTFLCAPPTVIKRELVRGSCR